MDPEDDASPPPLTPDELHGIRARPPGWRHMLGDIVLAVLFVKLRPA